MRLHLGWMALAVGMLLPAAGTLWAQGQPNYEQPPIQYSKSTPTGPVARLISRIKSGKTTLAYDETHGYLKSFLESMKIPASSQVLVFSKTSFQRRRITPWTPRALYFNDDVYVGWVQRGDVMELSSVDPKLGSVFYTLDQNPVGRPKFERQTYRCLQCHDSGGLTLGVPGHMVRSVFPSGDGLPLFSKGTFRTTPRSPFKERWGGWYVTGDLGDAEHMGNAIYRVEKNPEFQVVNGLGVNRAQLSKRVRTESYLAGTSDIVALLVLEHQTQLHNLITRANHETRRAVMFSREMNKLDGAPLDQLTRGAKSRIRSYCEPLVEALFFSGEASIPEPVKGDSSFASDFEKRGPFDAKKRSLRQFDLETRTFRYPLSFLVYSKAFAGLPKEARAFVSRRMTEVLEGVDEDGKFSHLTPADRKAIREILDETLPGWHGK